MLFFAVFAVKCQKCALSDVTPPPNVGQGYDEKDWSTQCIKGPVVLISTGQNGSSPGSLQVHGGSLAQDRMGATLVVYRWWVGHCRLTHLAVPSMVLLYHLTLEKDMEDISLVWVCSLNVIFCCFCCQVPKVCTVSWHPFAKWWSGVWWNRLTHPTH